MTVLQTIRQWIGRFPQYDTLEDFSVDWTGPSPNNGGIMPGGLVEISRIKDAVGCVTVQNQYNFTLYFVFPKAPDDDEGAEINAQWLLDFQEWVHAQSCTRKAPQFGDEPSKESIKAQNGALIGTDNEGTALYSVQLSIQFIKKYQEENLWLT